MSYPWVPEMRNKSAIYIIDIREVKRETSFISDRCVTTARVDNSISFLKAKLFYS